MARLAAIIVAVAIVVFLFGPTTIAAVTGRPLSVECGGLEPTVCDEAWRAWANGIEANWLPVTWVVVEPRNGSTCGDYTIGRWWPFYDPLAITMSPLCN